MSHFSVRVVRLPTILPNHTNVGLPKGNLEYVTREKPSLVKDSGKKAQRKVTQYTCDLAAILAKREIEKQNLDLQASYINQHVL